MNNTRRIAQNSIMMYVRMFIMMLISLYTSRVILSTLGVEDYGTYCLAGSIVALFASLQTLFASSTQRFLNYEMGRGNNSQLRCIFNMSMIVNLMIAVAFVLAVEIVGIWFLNNKINIDPERVYAAKIVFQCSVITALLSLLTTSYDAAIIAHENMNAYALLAILESVLKLVVVILLPYMPYDKLISYAVLLVIAAFLVKGIMIIYARNKFDECRLHFEWDTKCFKEMSAFAWWNFLGNTAYSLTHNGIGMIMNTFGGVIVNAARGIAYNVNTITEQFINNIVVVINPHIIKTYSRGELDKFYDILFLSSKILFIVQACMTIPLVFMTNSILKIWLGTVPEYSVAFLQILLINTQIRSLHQSLDTLFKAVGRIREYQIIENVLLSSSLIWAYLCLKAGASYNSVFIIIIIVNLVAMISIIFLARKIAGLSISEYLKKVISPCLVCFVISSILYCIMNYYQLTDPIAIIAIVLVALISVLLYMFYFGLSNAERGHILLLFKKN